MLVIQAVNFHLPLVKCMRVNTIKISDGQVDNFQAKHGDRKLLPSAQTAQYTL